MQDLTLKLILKYLHDNHFIEAFLSLEAQAHVSLSGHSSEIQFLRKVIMKGDFPEAIQFLKTFEQKIDAVTIRKFTLLIYKQKLYELLEDPEEAELRNLFEKEIIHVCTQDEYQDLFTLLTCRSVKQIEGLAHWTPTKGRYLCFQTISRVLEDFFPRSKPFVPEENIEDVIAAYYSDRSPKCLSSPLQRRQFSTEKEDSSSSRDQVSLSAFKQEPIPPKSYKSSSSNLIQEIRVQKRFKTEDLQNQFLLSSDRHRGDFSKKKETNFVKLYGHPPRVEELEDDQNDESMDTKKNRLGDKQADRSEECSIREEVGMNAAYLEQNNSLILQEDDDNFTFSQNAQESSWPIKIRKVATVRDAKAIRTFKSSPNASYLAIGTNSSSLRIFSLPSLLQQQKDGNSCEVYQIPHLHSKPIFCLDWSANERSILTCSSDCTIKLTELPADLTGSRKHQSTVIGQHESGVRMVKFQQRLNSITSCGDDGLIKVWDVCKYLKCTILQGHEAGVTAFQYTEDPNILFSSSRDRSVKMWDLRASSSIRTSDPQQSEINHLTISPKRVAACHSSGTISFYNPRTLKLEQSAQMHDQEVRCIDNYALDGLYVAGSFDGHLSLFKESCLERPVYHLHNGHEEDKVVSCGFLNGGDGRLVGSSSTSGYCNIFTFE